MVVSAEVAASDADDYLLHQPAGTTFWMTQPRADNVTLDVVRPLLQAARLGPRSTMAAAVSEGGVAPTFVTSLTPWDFGGGQYDLTRPNPDDDAAVVTSRVYFANKLLLTTLLGVDVANGLNARSVSTPAQMMRVAAHPGNLELDLLRSVDTGSATVGVTLHLSVAGAPAAHDLMPARVADPRIGFFKECFTLVRGPPPPRRVASPHFLSPAT